MFYQADNIQIL